MQIKAIQKLNSLFANGNISTLDFHCAICDSEKPIHKHHENYDMWFSFIPLCPECHGKTRKHDKHVVFNRGTIENLIVMSDTGERVSGHIVWLAIDKLNNKYHIRKQNGKITYKEPYKIKNMSS